MDSLSSNPTTSKIGALSSSNTSSASLRGGRSPLAGLPVRRKTETDSSGLSTLILIILAILILVATYCFPSKVTEVEGIAKEQAQQMVHDAFEAEKALETQMMDWLQKNDGPKMPIPEAEHPHFVDAVPDVPNEATARMIKQSSTWVDGEKKLKIKLNELAERQARGLDIGVPVLTRYLGEDIPAWAGEGVNVDEWNAKVKTKYEEMRQAEVEWKKEVAAFLERQKSG